LERRGPSLREGLQPGAGDSGVFYGLKSSPESTGAGCVRHGDVEGFLRGVGGTGNEGLVAGVDVGHDECSGVGVGAGNHEVLDAHDVVREAYGDEAVDVLLSGNEDLPGHMAALFSAGCLVLDVNGRGASLDEELGELEDGSEAAVPGVGVCDDGVEVI